MSSAAESVTVQVWLPPRAKGAEIVILAGAPVRTSIPAVLADGVMVSVPAVPAAMLMEARGPAPN